MANVDLEHLVCKENVDRFRVGLQDEPVQQKPVQFQDMFSRELLKLQEMFPDQERRGGQE